jgi:O-antigen biosynthesis protein
MDLIKNIINYLDNNEIEKAYELIAENESELGENAEFINAKSVLCIKTGEYRTAVSLLKRAVEVDPENQDLYYNLSYAYEMLDEQSQIGQSKPDQEIIVKRYTKRISHDKDCELPSRAQSFASAIEDDAPLVSIILLAYNKLDYTKLCIDSIYKYTYDVDYELILVDNGSTDDTFEYFKSLPNRRIVRLEQNQGPVIGLNEGWKVARGKYIAGVCNDFIFTKNWLSNLVKCIESDEKIGMVSPGASSVSNLQQIDLEFTNEDEMQIKAAEYNVSDPTKWEERIRLLPCVLFVRREIIDYIGCNDPAFYYGEFADDDISFRIRRNGYKLIYCGDTYTYHFGSVTTEIEHNEKNSLQASREVFINKYGGVDPWKDVKYDLNFLSLIDTSKMDKCSKVKILAIDPRCGNTLVMAKNRFRKSRIFDVELYAYVQDPLYFEDLRTICTEVKCGGIDVLWQNFSSIEFDYILFDEAVNTYTDAFSLLKNGLPLLKNSGEALLSTINNNDINRLNLLLKAEDSFHDSIKNNLSIEKLVYWLDTNGYKTEKIIGENHILTAEDQKSAENIIDEVCLYNNKDNLKEKLLISRYLTKIYKA